MNYIAIILALWIIIAIFDYSEFCYYWQLKEYRRDKFLDFLSSKRGLDFLKSYLIAGRLLILAGLTILYIFNIRLSINLIAALLGIELVCYGVKFFKKNIRRPKITIKSTLIISFALGAEIIMLFFLENIIVLIAVYALRFLIISFVVVLFSLPTKLLKKIYVRLAARNFKKYPDLKVIGVTGSYGKTTVKNFLAQILSGEFRVVATPKNINTEIGIAKFILNTDFSGVDIFVVEMGSYKIGEIKLICNMVRPAIGILTAINEQHLSLFGSIKNIQAAKYELLFSLPTDGLAVVNADNKYAREFLPRLKCKVKAFGRQTENKPDCFMEKVETTASGAIRIGCVLENKKFELEAPVAGKHNAYNIAACIIVANYLGMSEKKIIAAASSLKLPDGTLKTYSYGTSIIIDDSYNANPDGFLAALEVLKSYSSDYRKIVITRGMLELGKKSSELHRKVGQRIFQVADELVIISEDSEKDLRAGAGDIKIMPIYNFDELLKYVRNFKNDKVAVLLENRISSNVVRELIEK